MRSLPLAPAQPGVPLPVQPLSHPQQSSGKRSVPESPPSNSNKLTESKEEEVGPQFTAGWSEQAMAWH